MRVLSCCVRPAVRGDVEEVFLQPIGESDAARAINDKLAGKDYESVRNGIIRHLRALRLVDGDEEAGYDTHPLIRRHFYEEETGAAALTGEQREAVHSWFFEVLPDRQKKHHPDTLEEMQADLFGARASPLMELLLEGHERVVLSDAELERLVTWMDTNALFYGTFDPEDQSRQRRGERIAGPALQ